MSEITVVGGTRVRKAVKRTCENCGKTIYPPESDVKRGRGRFCGNSCSQKFRVVVVFTPCWYCGELVHIKSGRIAHVGRYRYCSTKCGILYRHANAAERNRGRRHYSARAVYHAIGGERRCVIPWCDRRNLHIHHIDHNPNNNRPKNLLAICEHHHTRYHRFVEKLGLRREVE